MEKMQKRRENTILQKKKHSITNSLKSISIFLLISLERERGSTRSSMSSWAWCQQLLEHLICAPRDSRGRGLSNDSWNYTLVEATESFFLEDHFSSRWDIGVLHLPRGLFHSLPYLRNLPVAWDKTTCNYFINLPLRVERIIRSHFIVASIFEKCLRLQPCLYVVQWDGSHSSRWASHQGTHEICKQTVTSLRSVQNLQTLIYTHNHSSLWDVHHLSSKEL